MRCPPFFRLITSLALTTFALSLFPTSARADDAPLTADTVYDEAFHLLAAGDQKGTEAVLQQAAESFPKDVRLAFFRAACMRSRFSVRGSLPLFRHVIDLDRSSVYAQASARILLLDFGHQDPETHFAALALLVAKHSDDPLLTWMAAVQCRSLKKTSEGIAYFETFGKSFDPDHDLPGPVLFHQTYANLLDDAKRYLDALPHRELAVKLEPASWSYQGLGITTSHLHRWVQSEDAFTKATSLDSSDPNIWVTWAFACRDRSDWNGVIEKCSRGVIANPHYVVLWNLWGDANTQLKNYAAALQCYARAMDLAPNALYPCDRTIAILELSGQSDQAQLFRARADALRHPNPTTAPVATAQ